MSLSQRILLVSRGLFWSAEDLNLKVVQLHRSPIRDISAQPLSVPVKKTPEDLQMLFIRKRGVYQRRAKLFVRRKEGDEVFTYGKQRDWLGSTAAEPIFTPHLAVTRRWVVATPALL